LFNQGGDGHGPQCMRKSIEVHEQQYQAKRYRNSGNGNAKIRDKIRVYTAKYRKRISERSGKGGENDLLQPVVVHSRIKRGDKVAVAYWITRTPIVTTNPRRATSAPIIE
jgi:hypothetical protein